MKVIFLDIDHVLNSTKSAARFGAYHILDPENIKVLNKITDETGAKIVISSSWRKKYTLDEIKAILKHFKVRGEIIDRTRSTGLMRGVDIQCWLMENKNVESFVIIDDSSDMLEPHLKRLVKTGIDTGLHESHIPLAVALLNKPLG